MGLEFEPLYFIYHDCWDFKESRILLSTDSSGSTVREDRSRVFHHAGHVHLFINGFDPLSAGRFQAYTGEQVYNFSVTDEWGPNSKDPNQSRSVRLVGKPIWYFHIDEYWRRMYVQPWSSRDPSIANGIHNGKSGIMYDASLPQHSLGPFREGAGMYFYGTSVNRTLPVEYWRERTRHVRDCFVKRRTELDPDTSGGGTWSFDRYDDFFVWAYDGHHEPESWGYGGGRTHRLRNLHSSPYYHFNGTNAKRLRKDGDNASASASDSPWEQRPWSGWYEVGESVLRDGVWYVREWRPAGYDPAALSGRGAYSARRRRQFPNPPPELCLRRGEGSPEQRAAARWEYFHYYGLVRVYGRDGGYDPSADCWETRRERWMSENALEAMSDAEEEACMSAYLSELGGAFFGRFSDPPGDPADEDRQTYVTVSEFLSAWRRMTTAEVEAMDLDGDYPRSTGKPLPKTPEESAYGQSPEDFAWSPEPSDRWLEFFRPKECFTIPRGRRAGGDRLVESWDERRPLHPRESSYSDEDGARRLYSDGLFVGPVLEYQKVTRLDWERLPEKRAEEERLREGWRTEPGGFGDGFSVSVSIPFRKNGRVQSPFSGDDGAVGPAGTYFHDCVKPEDMMRYRVEWCDSDMRLRRWFRDDYDRWLAEFEAAHPGYSEDPLATEEEVLKARTEEDSAALAEWWGRADAERRYSDRPLVRGMAADGCRGDGASSLLPDASAVAFAEGRPGYVDSGGKTRRGGRVVEFSNPYPERTDGAWVEQCLGAVVRARAVLVLEDPMGYRWRETVEAMEMTPADVRLRGSDHGE